MSSSLAAPVRSSHRVADQIFAITDEIAAYALDKEERIHAVQVAKTRSEQLASQVAALRRDVALEPNDLGLRLRLLAAEEKLKRALVQEKVAKEALTSPSIAGPPAPSMRALPSPSSPNPVFPPSPPRTCSPSPAHSRTSSSSSAVPVTASRTSASRRPTSTSFSRTPHFSPASSGAGSPVRRPLSLRAPPTLAHMPHSDPTPTLSTFPRKPVLITSHLSVPGHLITQELGLVQVRTPSTTDLGALKELLRLEGERRGADAVLGVVTKVWQGEGGGLAGAGRAVRLKKE
ncbi:glutaredoxin [Rhodotorula toruloides]|uniref:Glutaredoxin n=1 Tax=Rhodotorula toruloides TaxID=5286 RepID=A0A511KPB3_RHOTO|nr:glutaredoxin [Rhodotorula toruloides]